MKNTTVAIVSQKKIISTFDIDNQTMSIQAVPNIRFALLDKDTKLSPKQLRATKKGNDLIIQKESDDETHLIIKDFFSAENVEILGIQDGHFSSYGLNSSQANIETTTSIELGSTTLSEHDYSPLLLGLLGIGAAGIAAASNNSGKSTDLKSTPLAPTPLPTLTKAVVTAIETTQSVDEGKTLIAIVKLDNANGNAKVDFKLTGVETADYGNIVFGDGVTQNADGTLNIPKGVQEFNVAVPIVADKLTEGNQNLVLGVGSKNATIQIMDTSTTPIIISLDNVNVDENEFGVIIGNLTTNNETVGDTYTYSTTDNRFEIVNNQLKLKDGVSLDYEAANSIPIEIIITNAKGLTFKQGFNITVNDVNESGVETLKNTLDEKDNTFIASDTDQRNFIINSLDGVDNIKTANQTDIVRGGTGKDSVETMGSNDALVVVGKTVGIDYKQSDITNAGGSGYNLSNVVTLQEMKAKTVSDLEAGEILDGGSENNTLITYGEVDLTQATIKNIAFIRAETSDIHINAQQLNQLNPKIISADGDCSLTIKSADQSAITVDFSTNTNLHLFKNITLDQNVTLKVNNQDLYQVQNIMGHGTLQIVDEPIDLTGINTSVTILDKNGNIVPASLHRAYVIDGEFIQGTMSNDTIQGSDKDDRLNGSLGNDVLKGGLGNDIIRGGAGVDTMDGGAGDDTFIVLGDVSVGGKKDTTDLTNLLGMPISTLNGKVFNDDEDGAKEIIIGGDGNDTLIVIGTADISNYQLDSVEKIEIHSDVTVSATQLDKAPIQGDANSTLRISSGTSNTPVEINLKDLDILGMGHIEIGKNVIVHISDIKQLGGASIISGEGKIVFDGDQNFTLPDNYTVTDKLIVENSSGQDIRGKAEILTGVVKTGAGEIIGTDGNDFIEGNDEDNIIYGLNGNDVLSGKGGSDTFVITGAGKKIILDSNINSANEDSTDSLDFSGAKSSVNMDLSKFTGTVGTDTTVQLGAQDSKGVAQGVSSKTNLMLIIDDSGSMSGSRINEVKTAVDKLLSNYEATGEVAVRLVTFGSGAYYDTSDTTGWKTPDEVRAMVNKLSGSSGGTNYNAAMDSAKQAFIQGQGNQYFKDGNNVSFFLSDGEPNNSVYSKENDWENFVIENKITSFAVGFGGLNSTYHLEPISFDGQKVSDINANHDAGEIKPLLATELSKLSETLNSLAKTDFIENVQGSDFDDVIVGNSLSNTLFGGKGNDTITGMGGNNFIRGGEGTDTAVYLGKQADYKITWGSSTATITHIKDGNTDTIFRDIEKLKFADGEINTVFTKVEGITDPFPNKLMSQFAKAAYLNGADDVKALQNDQWEFLTSTKLNPNDSTLLKHFGDDPKNIYFEAGGKKFENGQWIDFHSKGDINNNADVIHGSAGAIVAQKGDTLVLSFRGTEDVGISNTHFFDGMGLGAKEIEPMAAILRGTMALAITNKYHVDIKHNGIVTDDKLKDVASEVAAMLIKTPLISDILSTTFAISSLGTIHLVEKLKDFLVQSAKISYTDLPETDSTGWVDQASHYAKYEPLLKSITSYVNNPSHGVSKVLVTGHSLGGGMASWYISDNVNGSSTLKNVEVKAMPYATPGIADFDAHATNVDTIRAETARDFVADVTDLLQQGINSLSADNNLHSLVTTQLGSQYNVIIETLPVLGIPGIGLLDYFSDSVGKYHNIDNYKNYVQYFEDTGLNQDLAFLKSIKNESVVDGNISNAFRPILSTFLDNWDPNLGDRTNYYNFGADTTGDYGAMIREQTAAELYSENDIIIGTNNNDRLIGDGDGSVNGTNDIFYLGKGSDEVYGDQSGDDDGGLDTVVYKFENTQIATGDLSKTSISGNFLQDRKNIISDMQTIHLNIDNSTDSLTDIEQIHFVDKASDDINLLAGGNDASGDRIRGLGGNDYLFGAGGNDTFFEGANSGNDRIHGGTGWDNVTYESTALKSISDSPISIDNFSLKVNLQDGTSDHLYSIESITTTEGTKSTRELIEGLLKFESLDFEQTLLNEYKPIFNYKESTNILEGKADNLQVFGKVIKDSNGKITGLDYELREEDVSSDDSWFVHVALGDDLLPTYFYTETGGWAADNTVQVRNAFDTELKHTGERGNNINVYLEMDNGGAYLTPNKIVTDNKFDNYTLKTAGIKSNEWDFDDNKGDLSKNYEQSNNPKLAGLDSGQMEMGFLFQDTPIAKLGHFDLIGSAII